MIVRYQKILLLLFVLLLPEWGLIAEDSEGSVLEMRACMGKLVAHNYELRARYLDAGAMSYSRTLGLAGIELALPLYTGGRLQANQRIEERLAEAALAGMGYGLALALCNNGCPLKMNT